MFPKCHRIELIFINPFFTYGLPCHKIEFLGLYKIWTARQSIPVIHFVTSFLPLDFQTPSSSPTPGKYNVFYFNFFNVSSGANFSWVCPKLHRIALIFVNPIFHDQSLSYWYLFIIELNSCMSQSRTRWISYELIPSASLLTSLHAHSHPYSYLHPLPLIEKQVTVQPVLSGHSRGMAAWPLHTGWLLCRFLRIGVLWKTIKIVPFCTTIDHFMHRNYLINTIGFICVVPLLVTVQYRLKTI